MANSGFAVDVYSGRPSNDLILEVWRDSVSGNATRWAWRLTARKFDATSFVLDPYPWAVNVLGDTWSGNAALDFRNTSSIVIASGVTGLKSHNSAGNLTVTFSASHTNVSIFGTASLSGSFAADQLPTVPNAPTPLGIDQLTPTSFRYRFQSAGGGSATSWEVQVATASSFASAETFTSSGTSTITGRTPGTRYWVRARGLNSFGAGAWSTALDATLPLNAPTLTSWAQNAAGGMVATWTPPSPSTGLSGYRLEIATDAGFTAGVQLIDLAAGVTTHTVTGGVGGRRYYARVAARTAAAGLGPYSASRDLLLILAAGDLDGWQSIGTKPAALSYYTAERIRRGTVDGRQALVVESVATAAVTLTAGAIGIQRTITGLVVGKSYRFTAHAQLTDNAALARQYRLNVISEGAGSAVELTPSRASLGTFEFVADATSATLQLVLAADVTVPAANDVVERVAFTGISLVELVTDYPVRLRETVYESNLANHFDLACNSVGASWYVAKDGVTRFRLPGAALPVAARFTDQPDDNALHYVDVSAVYDTRGMVNRLDVTNYGVTDDRLSEQNDNLIVVAQPSIDLYGVRSSRLDVNLWGEPPYDNSLDARLTELLTDADEPRLFIAGFRWNAQEDLAAANALEVGQRITVTFKGTEQDSQIVSLQHTITPRRWLVDVTLRRL